MVSYLGHCGTSQYFLYDLGSLALHIAGVHPTATTVGRTRRGLQSALGSAILVSCVPLWLLVVLGTLQGDQTLASPILHCNTYGPLFNPSCADYNYSHPEESTLQCEHVMSTSINLLLVAACLKLDCLYAAFRFIFSRLNACTENGVQFFFSFPAV